MVEESAESEVWRLMAPSEGLGLAGCTGRGNKAGRQGREGCDFEERGENRDGEHLCQEWEVRVGGEERLPRRGTAVEVHLYAGGSFWDGIDSRQEKIKRPACFGLSFHCYCDQNMSKLALRSNQSESLCKCCCLRKSGF